MEKEFYTVKELAQKFRVTERTIRNMMELGELAYYQIGRQKRISKEDMAQYLARQKREKTIQKIG
jgi:excisionase family DNA binding protein